MGTEVLSEDRPFFTAAEARQVSGVGAFALRNWVARNHVRVGTKHRSGRWLFSASDVFVLTVVEGLMAATGSDVLAAGEPAEKLRGYFVNLVREPEVADSDFTGHFVIHPGPLQTMVTQHLYAGTGTEKWRCLEPAVLGPHNSEPAGRVSLDSVPRPMVVIPAKAIAQAVIAGLTEILSA